MAFVEGCRHSLELSIPVDEVEAETGRVVGEIRKRAKLRGFRPGKAPESLIRQQFQGDIRQKVLESLIPRHLSKQFEQDNLQVVGTPDISDVHFESGEPLRFKAEFEVVPEIELKEYTNLPVVYQEPQVSEVDIDQRIEQLREQKADYANVDPRPLEDGDHAVLSLESAEVKQDEMMLEVGGADTLPAFSENLRGMTPGEEKEFDVSYPEDYGEPKLAGKTVHFHAGVKGIRHKELPEVNDEFAQDLGDFRTVNELREALRKSIFAQREYEAQQEAKNKLVETLVDQHDFPVPEVFVDRQVRNRVEQSLRALAADGVDPNTIKLDWKKVKETQGEKARREVKASMLLSRIAEREHIDATVEEVDREVERMAKQRREAFAVVRLRLEKEGALGRIASHIQTEKTLSYLFEHARKLAE